MGTLGTLAGTLGTLTGSLGTLAGSLGTLAKALLSPPETIGIAWKSVKRIFGSLNYGTPLGDLKDPYGDLRDPHGDLRDPCKAPRSPPETIGIGRKIIRIPNLVLCWKKPPKRED